MYSGQLYKEFEKSANTFTTLKFVEFTDLDYLNKNILKGSKEYQDIFDK